MRHTILTLSLLVTANTNAADINTAMIIGDNFPDKPRTHILLGGNWIGSHDDGTYRFEANPITKATTATYGATYNYTRHHVSPDRNVQGGQYGPPTGEVSVSIGFFHALPTYEARGCTIKFVRDWGSHANNPYVTFTRSASTDHVDLWYDDSNWVPELFWWPNYQPFDPSSVPLRDLLTGN